MLAKIWNSCVDLVFPDFCEVCSELLIKGEKSICLSCFYEMPKTHYWKETENEIEKIFWGKVNIERACALFFYRKGSNFRPLIHKLKYQGSYKLGMRLGEELGFHLKSAPLYKDVDLIVPVPLHPKKERQRGYNQSNCISKGISEIMNIPVETNSLIRTQYTETQTLKAKQERWENVSDIFALKSTSSIENKHILLVDDVITTGSTMEACSTTILNNCNCKVSLASIGYASF